MLYLIGLGLNAEGISQEGMEAVKKCKRVYLESYTVDFPYNFEELQHKLDKKIISADREFVESFKILDKAKKLDIALLVYGSPLTATTHISLIQEAKESRVKSRIIHSASILDAVAESGLQLYKFGKIASMPKWDENFSPESFMDIVKENKSIEAHSLILIDIGLELKDALNQLEISAQNKKIKIDKILIGQSLGTKRKKFFYGTVNDLKEKEIVKPFCIVIPEKLHFVEKESLEEFT